MDAPFDAEQAHGHAPGFGPGRDVGPFRILRLLGKGGMGMVWLARDQRLGRRVALKVVEPQRLTTPGARDRFRREAAATAALAHPNVVTLYEVGELDGTPWVALEFVDGVTLRERLAEDPPPLREALGIAHAIASALAAAHRATILHRDLKPSNIILGRDGRPRVVDFGLARRFGDRTAEFVRPSPDDDDPAAILVAGADTSALGTPRYMAPEQWRREESTPASDVWALGLVLHELAHGVHPYAELERRALRVAVASDEPVPPARAPRPVPPALDELIARCLDKTPVKRPSAETVATSLARLLERAGGGHDESDSPFRGLAAFGERHADTFFGRDAEIAAFLERLREEPLMPVVGPSGAGKSSFVQAGVIPRLRERGWAILQVRPGRDPLRALAQRLLLGELPSGIAAATQAQETGSTQTADAIARTEPPPRQALGANADELAARLREAPGVLGVELRALADAQHVRVLLFVDQLEELYAAGVPDDERRAFLRALAAAADDPADPVRVVVTLRDDFLGRAAEVDEARAALSRVTVLRSPGVDALRDILVRPAERAGYHWDDGLVDEMIAQVAAAPAGLPLLAFTARQVWHRRDRQQRRLTRAAYEELGGVAGALAVHADGVIAGLGTTDERVVRELLLRLVSGEGTRRVVARGELLAGLPASAEHLLQRLVDARLVTTRRALAVGGDADVELAHESLLHAWERLARWIDEGREDRAFLDHAARTAALWRARGSRVDELWQGEALHDARRALARLGDRVPPDVAALLAASQRAHAAKRWRRRAILAVVVASLTAVAVVSTFAAMRVRREERQARHRFAEAQREAARAALRGGDLLAARARLRSSLEVEDSRSSRALWLRMTHEPLRWTRHMPAAVYSVAMSPDGETIAAVGQDARLRLIDRVTTDGEVLGGEGDQLFAVAWSRDSRWIATGAWDGKITLWDLDDRSSRTLLGHHGLVRALAFDAKGRLISAAEDGTVRTWDPPSGALLATWGEPEGSVADMVLAPDGSLVTASWDGGVRRWRDGVATMIGRHDAAALAVTLMGDDVVTGDRDGVVIAWNDGAGRRLGRIDGQVSNAVFDPATRQLIVGSSTGTLHFWGEEGDERPALHAHDGEAMALLVRDGLLVTGGNDHALRVWDLRAARTRPAPGHSMTVVGVDVSANGRLAASAGYDRDARIWDLATGRSIAVLRGHENRVYAVRFLPDGRVVTAAADGTIRLWDGPVPVAVAPIALTGYFYDAAVGPGPLVAGAATDGKVYLWRVDTGATTWLVGSIGGAVNGVAISPDGTRVAAGGTDAISYVYELPGGRVLHVLRGHAAAVSGVAFSPDGRLLATCDEGGEVRLWDVATGEGRLLWSGARSYRVAFSPDGALVGVASSDAIARLLDVTGEAPPRELRGHVGEVNEIRFSPDGAVAITGGNDATIRAWDVATGAPLWTPRSPAQAPPSTTDLALLEDLPAEPATARVDGPAHTVALGFASGEVGLWDRTTGERLDSARMHGPVVSLRLDGTTLLAESELGDTLSVDLGPLDAPYCELMRAVWEDVPVTWEGLRPVAAAPPARHGCR